MTMQETIYCRKTSRSYETTPLDDKTLEQILAFVNTLKPLDDTIKTHFEFVPADAVKCMLPWKSPHYIAIFSEQKEGYLTNIGFMFQQLDLYLQSIGLGSCWLGLGEYNPGEEVQKLTELPFVILMAFGEAKGSPHRDASQFKRKPLSEISDTEDQRLEPARLAPSGKDAQPWFFLHDGDTFHTYHVEVSEGLVRFPKFMMPKGGPDPDTVSYIDVGCALAHMYVSNPDTFRYFTQTGVPAREKCQYVGSFQL